MEGSKQEGEGGKRRRTCAYFLHTHGPRMTDWFMWPNPLSRGKPRSRDAVSVCCVGVCAVYSFLDSPSGGKGEGKDESEKRRAKRLNYMLNSTEALCPKFRRL